MTSQRARETLTEFAQRSAREQEQRPAICEDVERFVGIPAEVAGEVLCLEAEYLASRGYP
jgi:hypothetical protein